MNSTHYYKWIFIDESIKVAALVTFLAGPGGSYITGQDIKVDGGITAAVPYSPFFGET